MQRLGEHLRFFIRRKISEDSAWQAPVIVFSGARPSHALQPALDAYSPGAMRRHLMGAAHGHLCQVSTVVLNNIPSHSLLTAFL